MLKIFAFLTALASVVVAQNSTTTSSFVPTGLSPECTTFFKTLDTDATLGSCLKTMNAATAAFAPGSTGTATQSTISSTLSGLCAPSVSNACPESYVRTLLTNMYASCPQELTGATPNSQVKDLYEILYLIIPVTTSICAKDDTGKSCVFSRGGPTSSSVSIADILKQLYTSSTGAAVPNLSYIGSQYLAYLFYSPTLATSQLCTSCARQVLTAFMNFESNSPPAFGIANSKVLANQPALIAAINTNCPSGFLNGAVQAAGGLSGGFKLGAASSISIDRMTIATVVMGLGAVVSLF